MRKIVLMMGFLLFLLACRKDTIDLGPDYQNMIGNWISLNQDYPIKVCITKENRVIIYRAIERGINFKVKSIDKKELQELNGWQVYALNGHLKKTGSDYLSFLANPTYDTMEFLTGSEIVDQQLLLEFDNKFIREQ